MNTRWLVQRLLSMSPGEIAWRVEQLAREWLERNRPAPVYRTNGRRAVGTKLPEVNLASSWIDREALFALADDICAGRYSFFDFDRAELGVELDWHKDYHSGKLAPSRYSKNINYRCFETCGDIKYIWELSRHWHLVTLSRAFAVSGKQKYRAEFERQLRSWWKQCPYNIGVNWCSSLEVAIRLINWSLALDFFRRRDSELTGFCDGFLDEWVRSVFEHSYYTSRHLSKYSSANNHFVGEVAGLYIASLAWPVFPESESWRAKARRILAEEICKQIWPDGVNKEQSTGYHQFICDFFLFSALVGEAHEEPFDATYWERLEAMANFYASLEDAGGHLPMIGDLDDGHVSDLANGSSFSPVRSIVATLAARTGCCKLAQKADSFDEKSFWLLGEEGACRFEEARMKQGGGELRREFPDGGYYLLGDHWDSKEEARLLFDCGALGYLSLAAHGHADSLSVQLSLKGHEILIDSGNYCYFQAPEWRAYFKSTRAHNTLEVDGVDQSEPAGMFLWRRKAQSKVVESRRNEHGLVSIIGEHDGYQRLGDGVTHRRRIDFDRAARVFTLTDEVRANDIHNYTLHFHFAADCEVEKQGEGVFLAQNGPAQVRMTLPEGWQILLLRGEEMPILGWRATRFMVKESVSVLVARARKEGNSTFLTKIELL
jgi:Uncharacterized protein conserved in bacteria